MFSCLSIYLLTDIIIHLLYMYPNYSSFCAFLSFSFKKGLFLSVFLLWRKKGILAREKKRVCLCGGVERTTTMMTITTTTTVTTTTIIFKHFYVEKRLLRLFYRFDSIYVLYYTCTTSKLNNSVWQSV